MDEPIPPALQPPVGVALVSIEAMAPGGQMAQSNAQVSDI
ncbi:hypothetical protein J3A64_004771 [Pseudarthrobacter sp. PvP004]|nr:hypothetical protein [Pseudarthrobacter sp. PvP004]